LLRIPVVISIPPASAEATPAGALASALFPVMEVFDIVAFAG
jgi:hypothetical protein